MSIFTKLKDARNTRKEARTEAKIGREAAIDEGMGIVAHARCEGKMSDEQFARLRALKKANGLWWEDVAQHKGEVDDLRCGKAPASLTRLPEKAVVADSLQIIELKAEMAEARQRGYMSEKRYKELVALVKADKNLYWTDFCLTITEAKDLCARFKGMSPLQQHEINMDERWAEGDPRTQAAA